jgi:transketolase
MTGQDRNTTREGPPMAGTSSTPLQSSRKMGKATREAFGQALAKLGEQHKDIVVVDGDVHNSTHTGYFAKKFPERFFNVGIAESDMVGIASGLAASGKRAWASSFACFIMCNAYDQLRMSVAFPQLDVKIVGTHAGISIGEDGPSQMGIEDVSLACSLPHFTVVVPADEPSMHQAVNAVAALRTPAYLRAGRPNVPLIYTDGTPFQLGKANRLRDGKDLTIIANGLMVAAALDAADRLAGQRVEARVLDMHTVKPCDDAAVLAAARETGRIVVAEEHLAHGGLGSVVAMSVARQHPVPMRFVNLGDTFAESGPADALLKKYGLTADDIVRAALDLVGKKG